MQPFAQNTVLVIEVFFASPQIPNINQVFLSIGALFGAIIVIQPSKTQFLSLKFWNTVYPYQDYENNHYHLIIRSIELSDTARSPRLS